jgi:hypothetical protein
LQEGRENANIDARCGKYRSKGMADDDDSEVWEGAWKAVQLLKPVTGGEYSAQMTICERANDGLIRSIGEKFICQGKVEHDVELPAWLYWGF